MHRHIQAPRMGWGVGGGDITQAEVNLNISPLPRQLIAIGTGPLKEVTDLRATSKVAPPHISREAAFPRMCLVAGAALSMS